MPSLELHPSPVEYSGLAALAEQVQWSAPDIRSRLAVISEYGQWLVTTHQTDQGKVVVDGLVGFSVEATDEEDEDPTQPRTLERVERYLTPPHTLDDVKKRLGGSAMFGRYGWFNGDMTAKGLGSMMAHTPFALQPRSLNGLDKIAVRWVPFDPTAPVYTRNDSLSRTARILRHGFLFTGSIIRDIAGDVVRSQDLGTNRAMRRMEKPYEGAPLVFMQTPPIWQTQQALRHAVPDMAPHAVLVRGGEYADVNRMRRIGSVPTSIVTALAA